MPETNKQTGEDTAISSDFLRTSFIHCPSDTAPAALTAHNTAHWGDILPPVQALLQIHFHLPAFHRKIN